MIFNLQIDCGNDAFAGQPKGEVERLLRQAIQKMDNQTFQEIDFSLLDSNGNSVGKCWVSEVLDDRGWKDHSND